MPKKNIFGIRNTQYSIVLSIYKQPSAFNTTYTIQSCVNCPSLLGVQDQRTWHYCSYCMAVTIRTERATVESKHTFLRLLHSLLQSSIYYILSYKVAGSEWDSQTKKFFGEFDNQALYGQLRSVPLFGSKAPQFNRKCVDCRFLAKTL